MGAGFVAALPKIGAFLTTTLIGQVVSSIVINVALGALEFRDENGVTWRACDDDDSQ